jgi:putative transport protein
VLGIVLLVRNLPAMFGIDPVAAAKESEKVYGAKGHALPGTSEAFDRGMSKADVRVFQLVNEAFVGRPVREVFEKLNSPVLRLTRHDVTVPLQGNPRLEKGDLLTVGGQIAAMLQDIGSVGPEVANDEARHLDIDQADIVVTAQQHDAMRAISDKSKSTIPSFGYPVPYALSTVVFLISGCVAMLLS